MLAIRNFGHFWSRGLVEWGTRGSGGAGSLLGYRLHRKKPLVVDFREQIAVYALFTAEREVVYIGQSGSGNQRLFNRLRRHSRRQLRDRWTNFSWFGFRSVNQDCTLSNNQQPTSGCNGTNKQALDEIESVLLQLFEPRLNKQGPRWGKDIVEYYQYAPWEWEPDMERPLEHPLAELAERLDRIEQSIQSIGKSNE